MAKYKSFKLVLQPSEEWLEAALVRCRAGETIELGVILELSPSSLVEYRAFGFDGLVKQRSEPMQTLNYCETIVIKEDTDG